MIEVTIRSNKPEAATTFQFENDALQAFLTNASAEDIGCQVVSLQALGTPLVVTGEMPKPIGKQVAGIRAPLQAQTRVEAATDKAEAIEAGKRAQAEAQAQANQDRKSALSLEKK